MSLIDQEITDDLPVTVNPFTCNLSQCFSLEGIKLTTSVFNVIGWVEIELGILGVGCLTTRLFVTKSMFNKQVPIVLGSHQIKQIFAQANVSRMDCWQQPWRFIYEEMSKVNGVVVNVGKGCQRITPSSSSLFDLLIVVPKLKVASPVGVILQLTVGRGDCLADGKTDGAITFELQVCIELILRKCHSLCYSVWCHQVVAQWICTVTQYVISFI